MICSLAESGLDCFTIVLAEGREIVSLCKTWKPISNIAVMVLVLLTDSTIYSYMLLSLGVEGS